MISPGGADTNLIALRGAADEKLQSAENGQVNTKTLCDFILYKHHKEPFKSEQLQDNRSKCSSISVGFLL